MTNFSPGRAAALNAAMGHVILVVAFLGLARATKLEFHTALPQALIDASTYALLTLLITWLMLGDEPLTKRLKGTACGLLALNVLYALAARRDSPPAPMAHSPGLDAATLALLPLLGLVIGGWLARRAGWRWCADDEARDAPPFQFSLREAFAAVIVAACLLGLDRAISYRALQAPVEWLLSGRGGLIVQLVLGNAGLAFVVGSRLLTVAALSGARPRMMRLVGLVAAMYLVGLIGLAALGENLYHARTAARTATNGAILTMLHLLAFRAAGFRIDRAAAKRVEPLATTEATTPDDDADEPPRRRVARRRFDRAVQRLKRRLRRRAGAVAMEQRTRRRGRLRLA